MKKVCIVLQARTDSKRLPGKIFLPLGSDSDSIMAIDYLLDRLSAMRLPIILATTDRHADDRLAEHCRDNYGKKVKVFRGNYENVLKRIYDASKEYEHIIRVTGDDWFFDSDACWELLDYYNRGNYDYAYQRNFNRGCDCDIFRRSAIKKILRAHPKESIEHVEHFIKTDKFRTLARDITSKENFSHYGFSLSVDNYSDYRLAKIVYDNLPEGGEIFDFLENHTYLSEINAKPKISIYTLNKDYNKYLWHTVTSVLEQRFLGKKAEYIVLDYGSKDSNIADIARNSKHYPGVNFCFEECPNFLEANRKALSMCRGEYVMRVDADDILSSPEFVYSMYINIADNAAIIPAYKEITEDGKLFNCGAVVNPAYRWLPTCALIEKKRYDHVRYLEGQSFRDGTALFETFKKYNFPIKLDYSLQFKYRVHKKSITNKSGQRVIAALDTKIKRSINSGQ